MCGVELVPVERLKPADYNPRRADAERLALVRLSLSRLGFLLPIVATPDGEILSGHQRHAVAMSMGARQVPVMFVDIPQERRRGLNILFNRATNDIPMTADEVRLRAELQCAHVHELAERLPDLDPNGPEFWPCLSLATRSVRQLACRNVASFQPQSANVGRTLARLGVRLPIVLTGDDAVVNGIGRLEAAARKGRETIEAITVSPVKAEFARAMLNLLSMDFHFEGDNADMLRYGAFRRSRMRRRTLGTAYVIPVFRSRRNADFDIADPEHRAKWLHVCGDSVLDFGSGHGDEARMLREAGIDVTAFEPYENDGHERISFDRGKRSAEGFIHAVRSGKRFTSLFLSSVLNSVPFVSDREHIVCICAALCDGDSTLYASARSTKGANWQCHTRGPSLNEHGMCEGTFRVAWERGVTIGDLGVAPKVQKYYDRAEFRELFLQFFGEVEICPKSTSIAAICRKPRPVNPERLAAALRFEFDLPYPGGRRLGMAEEALAAFSTRLGVSL